MPVWNQEEFLAEALESAEEQTLEDIEIVCVDDGSTDSSSAILQRAAARDPRVRIVRQANQGVSAARNTGLRAARGRYLCFCDPDDVMDPRLLEDAIDAMRECHAQICGFKFQAISRQGRPMRSNYRHNAFTRVQLLTARQAIRKQLRGRIGGYLWAFVSERSVYEKAGVRFPVGRRIEDEARICQILGSATRIVRLPRVLYSYRLHPGSLLGSADPSLVRDWALAQKERRAWVLAHYPELRGFVRLRQWDLPGSLDYESIRQSLEFGLRLDPDSVAQRHSRERSRKRPRQRQDLKHEKKRYRSEADRTASASSRHRRRAAPRRAGRSARARGTAQQ